MRSSCRYTVLTKYRCRVYVCLLACGTDTMRLTTDTESSNINWTSRQHNHHLPLEVLGWEPSESRSSAMRITQWSGVASRYLSALPAIWKSAGSDQCQMILKWNVAVQVAVPLALPCMFVKHYNRMTKFSRVSFVVARLLPR